jgi:hypothetical protein
MAAIVGLAVGAITVLPAAAGASHTASGEPFDQDFLTGQRTEVLCQGSQCPTVVTTIDAHSGPSGENPTGTYTLAVGGAVLASGQVTCLSVSRNQAVLGLEIEGLPIPGGVFFAEDNSGSGAPDRFGGSPITDPPLICPPFSTGTLGPDPLWNLVVHDAVPFPAVKDQCKNGGWRNYGTTFKNQGDCVSFVATGGRNSPAG